MKKFATIAASSLLAIMAATANAQETTTDTVVATVNGVDITVGHLIIARAQLPQQYQQLPDNVLFDGLVEQLIQQQLLVDDFEDLPKRAKRAIENERRSIIAGEAISALSETVVTDEALQAAYDERFANTDAEPEFNASHILVETEEDALAVKARADAGEDFAELAKELSTGPSGPNGGSLGWFGKGMMVAEFETAVLGMDVDAVSEPVQTQFGWHIIKLNETREKPLPTLEEMRQELAGPLQAAALETKIAELEAAAEITRAEAGSIDPSIVSNLDLLDE